ncbi:antibiotic biosynthesis monooxygenase [Bombella sp. TMW 2.2559]|uniref:Antibiotic biosynthesis monooxygenase n=1 Tax=Bombella dulcis TaxID=2967339 RepID=A0ABT3WAN9_9PROT|nr:putative quinol monooxygenase [Bombella dulcis]MCX5616160.1 antibiotic biosynthesis monooxygenase [Bombella dulcis]
MMSGPLVVLAEFEAREDTVEAFLKACYQDAVRSVADEPGCLEFTVQRGEDDPNFVVLHEVYEDRAAFRAHETAPHFATFSNALKELGIVTKQIRFFHRQKG